MVGAHPLTPSVNEIGGARSSAISRLSGSQSDPSASRNQAAVLAKVIAENCGVPHAIKRVRATAQQVGLSRAERATNVQGAFKVDPSAKAEVAGRRLIVIDDVLTSGATSDACARALLRAGAAQVDVLLFARVVDAARTRI